MDDPISRAQDIAIILNLKNFKAVWKPKNVPSTQVLFPGLMANKVCVSTFMESLYLCQCSVIGSIRPTIVHNFSKVFRTSSSISE